MALNGFEWTLIGISSVSTTLIFIFIITSFNELVESLKLFYNRMIHGRRFVKLRFIGADSNESYIYVRVKGAAYETDDELFILNPKKATTHKGIKIFTYVLNNTFAHDFFSKPSEILQKIIKEVIAKQNKKDKKDKKLPDISDYFHDPFSEPYRADAALLQEAMTKRMLSNATMLDKFMKLITNPNLIRWAMIIGVASLAAAGMAFMNYNTLVNVPMCSGSITV